MTAAWRQHRERSNVATIRFIVWVALTFGRTVARGLLVPIAGYFVLFAPRARAASRAYLARALGRPVRWRDLYRHVHCFASTILDRVFLLNDRTDLFDVRLHGEDVVREVEAAEEGCVYLGAHMGSFEILHAIGRVRRGRRVWMAMYEENARKLGAVLAGINPALNPPVIALGHVDSMLKLDEALARGECVGLLADRSLHGDRTVDVDFLGAPMALPTGPFRVALMLRRPVVLMFGLYLGGKRYDIHFERLAPPVSYERALRDQAIEQWAREYAARLEHHCRQAPYNWFNFYDVWRH